MMDSGIDQGTGGNRFLTVAAVSGFAVFFLFQLLGCLLHLFVSQEQLRAIPQWFLYFVLLYPMHILIVVLIVMSARFVKGIGSMTERLGLNQPVIVDPKFFAGLFLFMEVLIILVSTGIKKTAAFFKIELQDQVLIKLFLNADSGSAVLIAIAAVLIAPVSEELLFRHILFRRLSTLFPVSVSAVVSAALFSACHWNALQCIPLFLLALILQLVYIRTKSILVPFVFHSVFNLLTIAVLVWVRLSGNIYLLTGQ